MLGLQNKKNLCNFVDWNLFVDKNLIWRLSIKHMSIC